MKTLELKASGKINLSIDVLGKRPDGYHQVSMVMQQIDLWDRLWISYEEGVGLEGQGSGPGLAIEVTSNEPSLPVGASNLVHKVASLMAEEYGKTGQVQIHIDKKIPMGAGLGGGSADAAAVFHGLNLLWNLKISLGRLMDLGVEIGADVPFLLMSQAASNREIAGGLGQDQGLGPGRDQSPGQGPAWLSTCALAEGIGEILSPLPALQGAVVLAKPDLHISTAEIYKSLDLAKIKRRPDTKGLIQGLHQGDFGLVTASMYNVLEEVAKEKHPLIQEVIDDLKKVTGIENVMMSGSGPTVFGLVDPSTFSLE